MCGIFGYIGNNNNAAQTVLDGLKLLEYRGYDSWGVAVENNGKIAIDKNTGKIGTAQTSLPPSSIGIGHTRWATHGGVTQQNAHPHYDCTHQVAVLHNGIVENFAKIKQELIIHGHHLLSETDTEVIPHLIEEYLNDHDFPTAVRLAFNQLEGLNAIVAIHANSKQIIAAKTGSPLAIGQNQDGIYIASDASGIIKYTNKILFLKDHEMVILSDKVKVFSLPEGKPLEPNFETVDWKIEDAEKGDFDHYMLKEILEQPQIVRNIAQTYEAQLQSLAQTIKQAKGTFFIGAGTAFHAGLAGTYLFSKLAKRHVNTAMASEFNYLEDFLTPQSLIIALSQSGETIDVIEPLNRAQQKGSQIAALVNNLGSTIYRMADHKILLGAGPEKAVASTKAYVAKLAILLMMTAALTENMPEMKEQLRKASEEIERLLQKENMQQIIELAALLKNSEHIYIIGRGVSYPTAIEAALKIKEVSYIHTEGLAGGELKHGTIALISKGTPCIVFAPNDETHDAILSNAMEIKSRGSLMIGISPQNSPIFDHWIEVKDMQDASIISQIIPIQLLSYYLALQKGLDPDKPRNLAKSVTVK